VNDAPLVVERLTRRYGTLVAVADLSFAVARGEMFGLIGPDGAGKTSTLRVALGILPAHGGSVRTCGLDPRRESRALASRVGYLSQRFSLYGDLTVDENIAFFADLHVVRDWRRRREELLELVRLAPFRDRLADRLSGGMKQKLALVCTLIHTPELLVLDEPTTGVDPVSRRDFWKMLAGLQRDGLTILMTTPYLDEAERCNRVALLDRGRLLALDTPDALRAAHGHALVEVTADDRLRAAAALRGAPGVVELESFGERLHVGLDAVASADPNAAAARLVALVRAAGVSGVAARPVTPSLEDVFVARLRAADAARGEAREVA
jgi:ABC-2 type transport system ATP-binding protein